MKKAEGIRYIFLVTLVAFLMNAILPFFAVYNLTTDHRAELGNSAEVSSLFGDKVLICTEDGFRWVSWEDIESGKENPEPHQEYKCPLCYVAANGTKTVTPDKIIVQDFEFQQDVIYLSYNYFSSPLHLQSYLKTRSPPHSSVI